jgi:hypothetical protein
MQPVISYIGTKAARVQCLDALNTKFSTVAMLKLDVQEFEDPGSRKYHERSPHRRAPGTAVAY